MTSLPPKSLPNLSATDREAARRSLYRDAVTRLDPADLPNLITAEQRHRCLLAARLGEEDLPPDERTAIVGGIAFADAHLIEFGQLAAWHRRAMRFPEYPALRSSDELGPRFAAARYVDIVGLIETLLGQTACKRGAYHRIRCPWHMDQDPSLVIFGPGRGWWCFVCQIGSSPLDFVMRLLHRNAVEALLFIEQLVDTYPAAFAKDARP